MKPPPPRRNYQQMVRVVRDSGSSQKNSAPHDNNTHVPYKLARAYGTENPSPVETRQRTLDELGINSRSSRQPESKAQDNYLSQRESTTLYHQLDRDQQAYFDGSTANPAPTRSAGWPGTKARAYLGGDIQAEGIVATPPSRGIHATSNTDKNMDKDKSRGTDTNNKSEAQTHPNRSGKTPPAHQPISIPAPPQVKKQTNLPMVEQPTLEGTGGASVDFDLRVSKPKPGKTS